MPARAARLGMPQRMRRRRRAFADDAYVGYDFQDDEPIVLANLEPAADGSLAIPLAELGRATTATIVVDDPRGTTVRRVALAEPLLARARSPARLALDPDAHATQEKRIVPLVPGARLEIADLATAQVHLVDSVERAHSYLLALRDEPALRELAFVTRWHELARWPSAASSTRSTRATSCISSST